MSDTNRSSKITFGGMNFSIPAEQLAVDDLAVVKERPQSAPPDNITPSVGTSPLQETITPSTITSLPDYSHYADTIPAQLINNSLIESIPAIKNYRYRDGSKTVNFQIDNDSYSNLKSFCFAQGVRNVSLILTYLLDSTLPKPSKPYPNGSFDGLHLIDRKHLFSANLRVPDWLQIKQSTNNSSRNIRAVIDCYTDWRLVELEMAGYTRKDCVYSLIKRYIPVTSRLVVPRRRARRY